MAKVPIYHARSSAITGGGTNQGQPWNIGDASRGSAGAYPPTKDTWFTSRAAGVCSNLLAYLSANSLSGGNGNGAFVADVTNGTLGNQLVTLTAGVTGEFEDTTHTDAVAAGNQTQVKTSPGTSTSGTATGEIRGLCFTATVNTSCKMGGFNIAATASATRYTRFPSTGAASATEDAKDDFKFRTAGTIKYGCVGAINNGLAGTATFGMRYNSATSGSNVVSIGTGAGTGQFEDSVNSDAVAAGDLVKRILIDSSTGSAGGLHVVEFETTDASMMLAITSVTAAGQTYTANTTQYEFLNGKLVATAAEADCQTKCGVAATGSLYECYVITNGVTATTTIGFRVNGADGNGQISIASSTTGWVDDTTHSDALTPAKELNWKIAVPNSGTNLTVANVGAKLAGLTAGGYVPQRRPQRFFQRCA